MKYERTRARRSHPSQNLKENVEYFDEYICFSLTKQYVLQHFQHLSNLLNFKQGSRNQKL